jgi:hypothetical protein
MLSLSLKTFPGEMLWCSDDAPQQIVTMPAIWGAATGTFRPPRRASYPLPTWGDLQELQLDSRTIHGRSCYLGQDVSGRHYFAKGIGWIYSYGWEPCFGNSGILPRWAAERERDFAIRLAAMNVSVVQPVAIIAHREVPDAQGGPARQTAEVKDLDGQPAWPSMYIYSSAARWRLADLWYLSERERLDICGGEEGCKQWLCDILTRLGESCGLLHAAGGHDYSLSAHNVFCDGTRVDFEYSYLSELPHPNTDLNTNREVWQDKERDGLRELAWQVAELLRLDVPVREVTRWWQVAYERACGQDLGCDMTTQKEG